MWRGGEDKLTVGEKGKEGNSVTVQPEAIKKTGNYPWVGGRKERAAVRKTRGGDMGKSTLICHRKRVVHREEALRLTWAKRDTGGKEVPCMKRAPTHDVILGAGDL